MQFSHVFYKEITVDESNIFLAHLTENNEVEQIKFKKSKIYAVSRLSVGQDIQSIDFLSNIKGKKAFSDILRTYGQEKKNDLDLKIYKESWFDIVAPFKKWTDVLIYEFQYYHTIT